MGIGPNNYTVKFDRDLPDAKEILQNLKINTGLDFELEFPQPEEYPLSFMIRSLKIKDEYICIIPNSEDLLVYTRVCERNYLEGAIYHALSQIGGTHSYTVPEWTKLKYEDIDKHTRLLHRLSKLKERWENSLLYHFIVLLYLILTYPFRKIFRVFFPFLKPNFEMGINNESSVKEV